MGWFNRGADDKSQNKGQVDPKKFGSDTERKQYQAGYEKQKQQEQQKKNK